MGDSVSPDSELSRICAGGDLAGLAGYPYWSSEVYGFGENIRRYAFYPKKLNLYIATDHGPAQHDRPLDSELNTRAYAYFYHSPRLAAEWKKISRKKCYVLYSPFVYYRKRNRICRDPGGKGTIAFAAKGTHHISVDQSLDAYARSLKSLPDKYQPVAVCMYYLDVQQGHHAVFEKHGIAVHSAGQWMDSGFPRRFYEIVKGHRYATSNQCGSYLFYCVEMGIPFFLHGDLPTLINRGDNFPGKGRFRPTEVFNQSRLVCRMFEEKVDEVTDEQKIMVERELGLLDGIGRMRMALILYRALAVSAGNTIVTKARALLVKVRSTVTRNPAGGDGEESGGKK